MVKTRKQTTAAAKDDQPLTPAASMIDETVKSKTQPKSFAEPARSGTKRSADDDTKQSKKSKKKTDDEKEEKVDNKKSGDDEKEEDVYNKKSGDDEKEEDVDNKKSELAILKGIFNFTELTRRDPLMYPTTFHQFVKNSIPSSITHDQLKDKVPLLKLEFVNKMKSCKDGKTPTFSKPIEKEMFEFGKKIWGGEIVEEMLQSGVELIEESKRIELERRWKELRINEMKLAKMRDELAVEQGRLILDALKSSSSD